MLYGGTPFSNPDTPRATAVTSAASLMGPLTVISGWINVLPLFILTARSNSLQIWLGVLLTATVIAAEMKSWHLGRRQSRSRKAFFFAPRQAGFHRVLFLRLLVAGAGSLAYLASMWFWRNSHLKRSEPAIVVVE